MPSRCFQKTGILIRDGYNYSSWVVIVRKRFVLVMDGGCLNAIGLHRRLEYLGYNVIDLADWSDDALATVSQNYPEIMLLDPLQHSDGESVAIAEHVSRKLNIPVVFIAGIMSKTSADPGAGSHSDPVTLCAFLLRPLNDLELGAAIEREVYRYKIDANQHSLSERGPALGGMSYKQNVQPKTRKDKDAAFNFMRQISPFSRLPEQSLRELVSRSYFSGAEPGEYITFEGQHTDASFIVCSGRMAMTKSSVSGRDLIVQLLGPCDPFGLISAMQELPEQLSARAQCETQVLWIPTPALLRILDTNRDLYKDLVEQISAYMRSSHDLSRGLAHDTVEIRVAALLLHLASKFARPEKLDESAIVIDITRQQIADMTGTTPETASRVTRAMHRKKILETNTPGVIRILDLEALKDLLTYEQFSG